MSTEDCPQPDGPPCIISFPHSLEKVDTDNKQQAILPPSFLPAAAMMGALILIAKQRLPSMCDVTDKPSL